MFCETGVETRVRASERDVELLMVDYAEFSGKKFREVYI